jgi:monoamine oxidase
MMQVVEIMWCRSRVGFSSAIPATEGEQDASTRSHLEAKIPGNDRIVGGIAAMYETMQALGFVASTDAWAGPAQLDAGLGAGKTVAILGAGIGGMATAYELTKAGYNCLILEALDRAGGRNFTARRGTVVIEESAEHGRTEQVSQLDTGLYLNLGPGRIPFHHRRSLHYCQEFNVPLEIYVISTTADLYQSDAAFTGKAMPRYRLANDLQTHIGELLSKAINKHALDDELRPEDRPLFLNLLRNFGDLASDDPSARIPGGETPRTGCLAPTTVERICNANPTLPLKDLLDSRFWQNRFFQPLEGEWQPTLFQPVGGMDKIVDAFTRRVGHLIRYRCEVTELKISARGVVVSYRDGLAGTNENLRADYCVSSIPIKYLKKLRANWSDDYRAAFDKYPRLRYTSWAGRPTSASGSRTAIKSTGESATPTMRSPRCGTRPTTTSRKTAR